MRRLKVCTDIGTIFFFDPSEGFKLMTDVFADGQLRIEEIDKSTGEGKEVGRFNEDRWAWYKWGK